MQWGLGEAPPGPVWSPGYGGDVPGAIDYQSYHENYIQNSGGGEYPSTTGILTHARWAKSSVSRQTVSFGEYVGVLIGCLYVLIGCYVSRQQLWRVRGTMREEGGEVRRVCCRLHVVCSV